MSSEAVVAVRELTKSYGEVQALRGLSLEIPAGAVVGLLGPNGAGKTTALKILTGYLAADSGSAEVCGFDVAAEPLAVKRRIGYLPENNPLYPEQRVADFLGFAHRARALPGARRRDDLERVVAQTGLEEVFHRPIGECSKGYRQRVGLAQALLHDPPLLILDEPTNGLDPNQAVEIRELVRGLGRTKTVILTSHVLPEVEALAERVILVHRGVKLADGPLRELAGTAAGRQEVRVGVRGSRADLERVLASQGAELVEELPAPFGDRAYCAVAARLAAGGPALESLAAAMLAAGLPLVELAPQGEGLEKIFRRLTHEAEERR